MNQTEQPTSWRATGDDGLSASLPLLGQSEGWFVDSIRRTAEFVLAVAVLVLGFPILVVTAIVIRLDSPGPALFSQNRVGRHQRLFRFVKFRTFFVDAKQRFPEMYAYQYTEEEIRTLQFKKDNDPRVTRVGRWLRKSTLDELPNFINVLSGDCAVVGPRPEIPEMLPYYAPEELVKFSVKPGLTGLAQVSGRNNLSFQETNSFDVYYVVNRSWKLDLQIFCKTAYCILMRKGAL